MSTYPLRSLAVSMVVLVMSTVLTTRPNPRLTTRRSLGGGGEHASDLRDRGGRHRSRHHR